MPYVIRKMHDSYNVIKKETGQTVSRHATHDKAERAIRAIYASESRKGEHKWFRK